MRIPLTILALIATLIGLSQNQTELEQLGNSGKLNLVPQYGSPLIVKAEKYFAADRTFIETVTKENTSKKGAKELVSLGFDYFYKGKLHIAAKRFNQAWLLDTTNAGLYFGYWIIQTAIKSDEVRNWFFGQNINKVNDEFSADKYFKKGQSLDSAQFYEKMAYAYGCSSFGEFKQSAIGTECCLKKLKFDDSDTIALQNLGSIYLDSRQFDDALETQNKSLALRKGKGFVYNDIAWIYQEMNNLDSAEAFYLKAMASSDISYFKPRINYCLLMEKKGQCAIAIPVIDKCIAALPKEGFFHYTKGKLLLCAGRKDEAVKSLKTAKKFGNEDAKLLLKEI